MASVQQELPLVASKDPTLGVIHIGELGIPDFKECHPVRETCFSSPLLRSFSFAPSIPEQSSSSSEGILRLDRKLLSFGSRTGRHLQRYNHGSRQVVGCIPYRYIKPMRSTSLDEIGPEELEVLVVSSQKGQALMFPKGGWESDESKQEAAMREAVEEAGVVGTIGDQLGKWAFTSKSRGVSREGYMFPLLVGAQLETWPEKHFRRRVWMKAGEAREECQYRWMKEALDELVRRLEAKEDEPSREL